MEISISDGYELPQEKDIAHVLLWFYGRGTEGIGKAGKEDSVATFHHTGPRACLHLGGFAQLLVWKDADVCSQEKGITKMQGLKQALTKRLTRVQPKTLQDAKHRIEATSCEDLSG